MHIRVKGDTVRIEGYVNAVERKSKTLQDRFGKFVERIKAGAFGRALKNNPNVRILLNHNWDRDLGGTDSNLKLEEDNIGLHARATITDAEVARDAREGNLVGWSFGFADVENGVTITEEDGLPVRNVRDLELYEVSLLNRKAIPAYDGTLVTVRADGGNINLAEVEEFTEIEIEDEPQEEVQERAEETNNDNEHADDNGAVVDYTKYKEIIAEMKGEN
jgi:HK97 family phage prohead protease